MAFESESSTSTQYGEMPYERTALSDGFAFG